MSLDAIALSIFASRMEAVCEEMGAVLRGAAFSPNIKDRLDFSCAVFAADGGLCAQAAHIPVHLGSMAYAMAGIIGARSWLPGDMVAVNDPYLGGTHLPDVTVIAPLFVDGSLLGFVANRAHHADIGGSAPGSMPLSRTLDEEGVVIPPTRIVADGKLCSDVFDDIMGSLHGGHETRGDFTAQISANRCGLERLHGLIDELGAGNYIAALAQLNAYGERIARAAIGAIPDGRYEFSDMLDDDGHGQQDIVIHCSLRIDGDQAQVDFSGTAHQVAGNINCPLSVAAAGVWYVFRCLMPDYAPACAGLFRPVSLSAPEGCLLNARRPAAVAAGNVETSMRVVDVIIGALAQALPGLMPAAAQGTMNNLAIGARDEDGAWSYYETMAGGMGAGPDGPGLSAVHSHMTNTLNTPIESLEMHYPVRVRRYQLRRGSGGKGLHPGGDGLLREYEFLRRATVSLLTERRRLGPWGLAGGGAGTPGENRLNDQILPSKATMTVVAGDHLCIATPGGGGWGER